MVLVAVQLSVLGLYLPPVFKTSCRYPVHPRRSFHCRSRLPCVSLGQRARWWCWWLSNYPCWDCISRRCSDRAVVSHSTPDDHFTAGPHCCVIESASGRVGGAGGCPTIRAGIVSPAGVQIRCAIKSTPDDHFTAGPHCRVIARPWAHWWCWWLSNYPCWDCISRRCSNCRRQFHPRRSFHCRSTLPCDRIGQWARWSCWWLSSYPCWDCISRRCSKRRESSTPNDHFTAGPHCRVIVSASGRVDGAGGCPSVIDASARRIRYSRKCVVGTRC